MISSSPSRLRTGALEIWLRGQMRLCVFGDDGLACILDFLGPRHRCFGAAHDAGYPDRGAYWAVCNRASVCSGLPTMSTATAYTRTHIWHEMWSSLASSAPQRWADAPAPTAHGLQRVTLGSSSDEIRDRLTSGCGRSRSPKRAGQERIWRRQLMGYFMVGGTGIEPVAPHV